MKAQSLRAHDERQPPWWEEVVGTFENDALFDEAMALGAAYRRSSDFQRTSISCCYNEGNAIKAGSMASTVTVELPDSLHQRLVNTAQAMQRSLEEVILRALTVGSPPDWANVPAEFQADLAALDRLEDEALWKVARSVRTEADLARYDELLELKKEQELPSDKATELADLRRDADRFMLRKAHAAALLTWRDNSIH